MIFKKIITGSVIQTYDKKTKKCVHQEFIAGDQVDYEDENGQPIERDGSEEYQMFNMEQPPLQNLIDASQE